MARAVRSHRGRRENTGKPREGNRHQSPYPNAQETAQETAQEATHENNTIMHV
jgi:hypothetical protein